MAWFSCQPCGASEPTQDTVKIDPKLFPSSNKENLRLDANNYDKCEQQSEAEKLCNQKEEQETTEKEAEEQRRQKEEHDRKEREAEEQRKQKLEHERKEKEAEEKRKHAEAKRLQGEPDAAETAAAQADRWRQQAIAEERARREAEETERAVWEAERQREEARRVAEDQARSDALQMRAEAHENAQAAIKVDAWCQSNGYQDMHTEKKTFMGGKKFALHTAVKHQNAEIVELIMRCGAKADVKDSKGNTPLQLAKKLGDCNIRDRMIAALS